MPGFAGVRFRPLDSGAGYLSILRYVAARRGVDIRAAFPTGSSPGSGAKGIDNESAKDLRRRPRRDNASGGGQSSRSRQLEDAAATARGSTPGRQVTLTS
jgi:hypothetical protein